MYAYTVLNCNSTTGDYKKNRFIVQTVSPCFVLLVLLQQKSMEIETERKQEKERRGVGWFNPAHENALRDPNKRREWTRKRNGKQKTKTKKKGETREGKKYCLCVWTYRQYYNIYNSMYTYIYKPVYTCTAAEAAAVSWRDALPNHVESSGKPSNSTFYIFSLSFFLFRSTFLYDRGAYLTIKPSWSLINKRRPSM